MTGGSFPNSGVENIIYLNQTDLIISLMTSSLEYFIQRLFFSAPRRILYLLIDLSGATSTDILICKANFIKD